jgi:hypothetical protein
LRRHEQARQAAHLVRYLRRHARTTKAIRAVAQDGGHRLVVGHHQHLRAAEPDREEIAILAAPAFDVLVHAQRPDLQGIAHQRPGTRSAQR